MLRIAALLIIGAIAFALPNLSLQQAFIQLGGNKADKYMLTAAAEQSELLKRAAQFGLNAYIQQSPGALSLIIDEPSAEDIANGSRLVLALEYSGIFVTQELCGQIDTGKEFNLQESLSSMSAKQLEVYKEEGLYAFTLSLPFYKNGIGFSLQAALRKNWLAVGMPALTQGY